VRLSAALCALSFASAACAVPATNLPCGSASLLGPYPYPNDAQLSGARIGPLLVQGDYEAGSRRAVVYGFAAGRPTKMRFLVTRAMDSDLTLTGRRCGDAKPLRFWLDRDGVPPGLDPTGAAVSEDVLAASGDLRAVIPRQPRGATTFAFEGYVLFPSVGIYRIEGYSGGRYAGEATIEVTSEIPVASDGTTGHLRGVCVESPRVAGLGLVGGDLAAEGAEEHYASTSDVKVLWRRRTNAGVVIELRADRLDDDGRVSLGLLGRVYGPAPGGWPSVGYPSTIRIGVSGCWRIRDLRGAPSDFIVIRIGPHRSGKVGTATDGLAFATGERELLRKLQDAGVWVTVVMPSRDEALLGGVGAGRYLSTDHDGAFNVLFLSDADVAASIRVCGERTPPGRYVYRLSLGGRSDTIESETSTAFIVSANALAIVGGAPELAGAVRHALAGRNAPC
jgi:hypothetical protein